MSSFFDSASLVQIPSGYSDGTLYSVKPIDGSGDLTFSRASNATRVASNGYIEKVRTNLLTYSNTFSNAAWINDNSTETSGQAGYDGTNNAWLLTSTSAGGFIYQNVTISGLNTFSVYAKAGSQIGVTLYSAHVSQGRYFNLSTGALGGTFVGTPLDSKIESIGSGWYRCSITVSATATNNFRAYVSNGTANVAGNILIQAAQVETGAIATQYLATTSSAVSVGPVSGLPRLDYSGGSTCPSLLLEPQRSNLCTNYNFFASTDWVKFNATITSNNATSPEGYSNASLLTISAATGSIYDSVSGAGTYTFSVFAKYVDMRYMRLRSTASYVYFDIQNGTVESATNGTGKIESYGNGWYRCSVTGSNTNSLVQIFLSSTEGGTPTGTGSALIYGAQFEDGSYSTSIIPTYGTAVTRVADAASKTGISSLIGQTEGVLFVDWVPQNNPVASTQQWLMFLGSGSAYISIFTSSGGKIRANVADTADQCIIDTSYSFVAGNRYKCALAYKANDFAFYVNGVLIGTDTSGTVPAVSTLQNNYTTTAANGTNAGLNQMLLFTTRLSNADLATLTA